MRRRIAVLLTLVLVGLVSSATLVWAHPFVTPPAEIVETVGPVAASDSSPEWRSLPAAPGPPWFALACVAVSLLVMGWRLRQAVAVAIVLALAIFAFEHGVHSVHHLNDRASGATCPVASAASQLAGTPVEASAVSHIAFALVDATLPDSSSTLDFYLGSAHQGRAPPLAA
jgi:hypothetical protein